MVMVSSNPNFTIHPLAALLPAMTPDRYAALKADILAMRAHKGYFRGFRKRQQAGAGF